MIGLAINCLPFRIKAVGKNLDWGKLPPHLAYLAAPAAKYGAYQFEDKIYNFLRKMSANEKQELIELLDRTTKDEAEINAFLDKYPMTKHLEARLVYFLGHLLALGNDAGFFPP
jgi:hypothetical protein